MTRSTDPALLAIEVQPRTRDLLSGHWPVVANPEPDELISSWLHRLAVGAGLPQEGEDWRSIWVPARRSGRLDLALPEIVRDRLVRCTGLAYGAVGGMTLAGVGARALLVPLRADLSPGRRGRRQAAWLQFCPQCSLPNTGNPISGGNRAWRRRSPIARHGSRLTDRCPASRAGIGAVQPGVAQGRENDCAPSRLRSRQREGAASRRGRPTRGRKFGDPRPTRERRELSRRRRHPRPAGEARSAASGGVDGAPDVRSRPRPACAGPRHRSPDRRRDRRGRQPKAACRKHAGGPEGVLACFAGGLCGRAPAAPCPHLKEIAAVRSSSS